MLEEPSNIEEEEVLLSLNVCVHVSCVCVCVYVQDITEDMFLRRHKKHEEDEKRRKRCVQLYTHFNQYVMYSLVDANMHI